MKIAIVALTYHGVLLGERLRAGLDDAELFIPEKHAVNAPVAHPFTGPVAGLVADLWSECDGFVCIMASGIVVRSIAPLLRGKEHDPAVVVLDEAGAYAISLLSGHLGGANELARQLASLSGGQAVITTATDVNGLLAWDEAARRAGLTVDPLAHVKHLNTLLLEGEPIALVDRQEMIAPWFADNRKVLLQPNFTAAQQARVAGMVFVTNRLIPQMEPQQNLLLLRPRNLVAGIGCNRGTGADEIEAAIHTVLKRAFLAFTSLGVVASIEEKRDEAGLLAFVERHKLAAEFYPAADLNAIRIPSPPSPHALAAVGAQGVCEPAALLSACASALLIPKQKIGNVTVAVAEKR